MQYASTSDVLKKLEELILPDPRFESCGWRPESLHAELKAHELNSNVPERIRHQFDNARNLFLYSWFVYGFTATSDLIAFSALEYALCHRISMDDPKKAESNGLYSKLRYAFDSGWFKDEHVRHFVRMKEIVNSNLYGDREPIPDDPESSRWLQRLKTSFPVLRNSLAHGFPALHTPDITNISICCDLINQLFPPSK